MVLSKSAARSFVRGGNVGCVEKVRLDAVENILQFVLQSSTSLLTVILEHLSCCPHSFWFVITPSDD